MPSPTCILMATFLPFTISPSGDFSSMRPNFAGRVWVAS